MILWDSKKQGGRPDTMKLLKETWASFGAEVIFITSNKLGNDEMMQGCRAGTFVLLPPSPLSDLLILMLDTWILQLTLSTLPAGLHAFGTLWDF